MRFLPAILSLLTGMAGWFYMFYSRAAHGLGAIEQEALNRRRVRLRRAGGAVMIVLAGLMYLGFYAVAPETWPRAFVALWLGVFALLAIVTGLALLDVRLTVRLRDEFRRRRQRDAKPSDPPPDPQGTGRDHTPPSRD